MKCQNCEKEFEPKTVIQKYCCIKCGNAYRAVHKIEYPSITFSCAQCGRTVVTQGRLDKRTRFCSHECERKYWRNPPWKHETSKTNFRSAQEYLSWERRTNEG